MAMARDNTAASGRAQARGIVLAGDRTDSRAAARRHSRHVRMMRIGFPIATAAIVSVYGLSLMQTVGWGLSIPKLEMPQIMPDNLAMQNPHYEGFNKDGGRYWVKAQSAQQDLKTFSLIKLNGITGELTDAKKQRTTLAAARGTFDNKANVLELYDSIDIDGDAGMKAKLTRATVDTKESIITSTEPVTVTMAAGTINANQMTARQKAKEYTFVDNVRTHLNAREPKVDDQKTDNQKPSDAAAAQPSGDQMIGASNAPVDILSNRLDVNDATKIALFTGTVTASQAGATLTTPELEVSYEGSAAPQGGADAANNSGGGKLKRMLAKNPVTMSQANGDTVTSHSADFDPVTQRAVLDGDVVMNQAPDRRATADKAEIDQALKTVVLTGDVVVTQAQNVLKGRRLDFNQATNKMQLTAPVSTGGAGRISARFQQAPTAGAKAAKPEKAREQGIAFGATFKTDPGAPVQIEAARLDVDDAAKQAVFTGDVRAIQGDFIIRANEITAAYTGSAGLNGAGAADPAAKGAAQLSHIKAKINVKITSNDGQNATGDWADFDPKANMATLGGDVVLKQGKNVVRGTKLVIDMTTGESVIKTEAVADGRTTVSPNGTTTTATGTPSRPSAVFYPGEMKANADKKKAKPDDGWQARSAP